MKDFNWLILLDREDLELMIQEFSNIENEDVQALIYEWQKSAIAINNCRVDPR